MIAKFEKREIFKSEKVWFAKWSFLQNQFHWHHEPEIIYCESGSLTIETQQRKVLLTAGESAIIPCSCIHKIISAPTSLIITIMFKNKLFEKLSTKFHFKNIKLNVSPDIPNFYHYLKLELTQKNDFYQKTVDSLLNILTISLFRNGNIEKHELIKETNEKQLYQKIIAHIEKHYNTLTFDAMCNHFGYSPSHFSRLFSTLIGTSFSNYLSMVKIDHAIEQLHENKRNLSLIADNCGFSNTRTFNRTFKKYTGYSPSRIPNDYSLNFEFNFNSKSYNPTLSTSIQIE